MSLLDGILKNVVGSPDTISAIAEKVGIDPAMAEKAVAALGQSHDADGDTVELAAEKTGLDTGTLSGIVEQLGGVGNLGQVASAVKNDPSKLMSILDLDGDGNPLNDVMGMAGKLFGKS